MTVAKLASRIAALLKSKRHKVVFAESCTGGLVCGALTRVAGISEHLCGGMVVYRNATKAAYLDIPQTLLDEPGPVSREVAGLMAVHVLDQTPEATIALSVTGHLGPNAPPNLDGRVFIGMASRHTAPQVHALRCRRGDSRLARQRWVVERALALLARELAAWKPEA
jgi:PncC family amidohydrolase